MSSLIAYNEAKRLQNLEIPAYTNKLTIVAYDAEKGKYKKEIGYWRDKLRMEPADNALHIIYSRCKGDVVLLCVDLDTIPAGKTARDFYDFTGVCTETPSGGIHYWFYIKRDDARFFGYKNMSFTTADGFGGELIFNGQTLDAGTRCIYEGKTVEYKAINPFDEEANLTFLPDELYAKLKIPKREKEEAKKAEAVAAAAAGAPHVVKPKDKAILLTALGIMEPNKHNKNEPWKHICYATRRVMGRTEEGLKIFKDYCSRMSNYDAAECDRIWWAIGKDVVDVGTLAETYAKMDAKVFRAMMAQKLEDVIPAEDSDSWEDWTKYEPFKTFVNAVYNDMKGKDVGKDMIAGLFDNYWKNEYDWGEIEKVWEKMKSEKYRKKKLTLHTKQTTAAMIEEAAAGGAEVHEDDVDADVVEAKIPKITKTMIFDDPDFTTSNFIVKHVETGKILNLKNTEQVKEFLRDMAQCLQFIDILQLWIYKTMAVDDEYDSESFEIVDRKSTRLNSSHRT